MEGCVGCHRLEVEVEELEKSLEQARSRAVNATRQAAKLKVELERKWQDDVRFTKKCHAVEEKEHELEEERARLKHDVKELKYRNKCQAKELVEKKKELREMKLRTNARLAELTDTVQEMEHVSQVRAQDLRVAGNALQSTVLDLQRHLGSQGFHAINSYTARRLLDKLWTATEDMCQACKLKTGKRKEEEGRDGVDDVEYFQEFDERSISSSATRGDILRNIQNKASKAALLIAAKDGKLQVKGNSSANRLIQELTKLCTDLEEENGRLQIELERKSVNSSSASVNNNNKATNLLPKYRLAIVEARAKANSLEQQLRERELGRDSAMRKLKTTLHEKDEKILDLEMQVKNLMAKVEAFEVADHRRKEILDSIQRDRGFIAASPRHEVDDSQLFQDTTALSGGLGEQVPVMFGEEEEEEESNFDKYFGGVKPEPPDDYEEKLTAFSSAGLSSPANSLGGKTIQSFKTNVSVNTDMPILAQNLRNDLKMLNQEISALKRSLVETDDFV